MYVAALDAANLADLRTSARTSRRGLFMPLALPRALASGSVTPDADGYALAASFDVPGCDVVSDSAGGYALRFDAGRYDAATAELVALAVSGASLAASAGAGASLDVTLDADGNVPAETADALAPPVSTFAAPSTSDLDTIRERHALGTVEPSDVYVAERWIANDALSRGGLLQLTRAALDALALNYAAGRSVLLFHDSRKIVGRTFDASVVRKTREGLTANWLRVKFYVHDRPSNADMISDIQLGILAYDSIGFNGGDVSFVEESVALPGEKKKAVRSFVRIDSPPGCLNPIEGVETSLVYLGQLHGAGNAKLGAARPAAVASPASGTEPGTVADVESGEGKAPETVPFVIL